MDAREEITTIFVVGFPEDMLEREFQNMFTFCPDFEAATLKIPHAGSHSDGEDASASAARKQIIGFAKFRTRAAAHEARNVLTGRKVDAERNCVLKAEMAKKNLHTKRGLATPAPVPVLGSLSDLGLNDPGYHFPALSTSHLSAGKRFDPFCTSAPVTPLTNDPPTAADFFPSHDGGVFEFYPDGIPSLDSSAGFLQRRNSVHHTILRDPSPALGTSAPAARAVGFGLTKTQSERRNTNPASLAHINHLFGTGGAASGPLLNKNLDLGGLNSRLGGLSLGGAVGLGLNSSKPPTPVPAGFPASSSVPTNGFAIPLTRSVNSNDQNPPCNTLYVGNLPVHTAEDELRALFAQASGYKRLCFRPKPNAGPICFVEFDDVTYATQAMRDLDGQLISSSTNGGIRLSFSKNPLGVRQQNGGGAPGLAGLPLGLKPTLTPPPSSAVGFFGSSLGSRHNPVLDAALTMEPTSMAIH